MSYPALPALPPTIAAQETGQVIITAQALQLPCAYPRLSAIAPPELLTQAARQPATQAQFLGSVLEVRRDPLQPIAQVPDSLAVLLPWMRPNRSQPLLLRAQSEKGAIETLAFDLKPDGSPERESELAQPASPKITGVIELTANWQEYDNQRRIFRAEGRVLMRFRNTVLDADRLQVNLNNRFAVAEGNVALSRGGQILRGDRFEYDLVQGTGVVFNATGEVFTPTSNVDFEINPVQAVAADPATPPIERPLSERLSRNQPPRSVVSTGGVILTTGTGDNAANQQLTGTIKRFRFQADRLRFDNQGWFGENVRLTNDPFSPPSLEVRADTARYQILPDNEEVLETSEQRIVLDQSLVVPIPRSRTILRNRQLESGLFGLGIDGRDRDGLYIERGFNLLDTAGTKITVTPQVLVQRLLGRNTGVLDSLGLLAEVSTQISPSTRFSGFASFASLDLSRIESNLRINGRLRQMLGSYTLALDATYRDRLFNGSLGFQDVQTSLGVLLISPNIPLGDTGFNLNYQVSGQWIDADSDRTALLPAVRTNNRIGLIRSQGSVSISRGFLLWQGEALPATAEAGLRYTDTPVVPFLQFTTEVRGTLGLYSSGDNQSTLTGVIGLQGQFGHFSQPFGDFTGFNISYSQSATGGLSPFLFDRLVDQRVLSGGIVQQLFGPIRFGFQTSVNLDTNRQISTDYILEYSRRAYGITLRYNPSQQVGALGLRISDFSWLGGTEPFDGPPVGISRTMNLR